MPESSLKITTSAKRAIIASIPGGIHGDLMAGLIWTLDDANAHRRWIVCAYSKARVHTKEFPGETINASGLALVVVQRDTKNLIAGKILDYRDEQFVLRENNLRDC